MPLVPCQFDFPISSYDFWHLVHFYCLWKPTYNVKIHNSQMVLNQNSHELWICRESHPLQFEPWMEWTNKKLCPGQCTVDFHCCPKIESIASCGFLSYSCEIMIKTWSNDDIELKHMMLTQNFDFWRWIDHFTLAVD